MRLGRPLHKGPRIGLLASLVATALLVVALACAPALAKPGKLVGKGSDAGFPIAYARGDAFKPRQLFMRVSGAPQQPVEVRWQVTCRVGSKKAQVPDGEFELTPTATRELAKGMKRPDDCTIDVQAAYVDAGISGTLQIELFARVRKKK